MAFGHGKAGVFKLDNSAGTLTDISAYCDNVDYPESVDEGETTVFGASAKSYLPGLRDATISLSGKFDATLDALMSGVLGVQGGSLASVSYEYGPIGSTTPNPKYTGECFISDYKINTPVGGVVTWSATLQRTSTHTRATY